ncbi:MAG: hydroxymethylbilane synthase [Synergistaceae bacterium]|jgi:porphobilinogen deaminase|nr:hydroxymethylbilane synthase [Synergistaceae bacterium]
MTLGRYAKYDRKIRVGSRDSILAVAQARYVMTSIESAHPEAELELVTMKTQGDRLSAAHPSSPLPVSKLAIKGLFVKELESALSNGEIDLAVHSLKDMSLEENFDLPIVAYTKREDPRDVAVKRKNPQTLLQSEVLGTSSLAGFEAESQGPPFPVAGCSSSRRRVQLSRAMRCKVRPIRGNVLTRLDKLDGGGEYDFLVLAAAGLIRLGLTDRISCFFSPDQITPAAGQGILACQGRRDEDYGYLSGTTDRDSEILATAERAFAAATGGGCLAPVAAYATTSGGEISLIGMYVNEELGIFLRGSASGPEKRAKSIGEELASKLIERMKNGESENV